jgi:hypothetical protein
MDRDANKPYAWLEFFDPLGWLYGATYLAIQSSFLSGTQNPVLTGSCALAALVRSLLLALATAEKGETQGWKPNRPLKIFTLVLTAIILCAGGAAHIPKS